MVLYSAFGGKGSTTKAVVRKPLFASKAKGKSSGKASGKSSGKGRGKPGKSSKGAEKGGKRELTGPNGEPADDATCWDVKQTGLCPRFPCKWAPCEDLPEDDPIFADAKKREKREPKGKGKGKKTGEKTLKGGKFGKRFGA